MFRFLAKFALCLATMAYLTAVTLTLIGSFLLTWPLLRKSPRDQRIKATMDMTAAAMTMIQVFGQKYMAVSNGEDSGQNGDNLPLDP